MKKTIAAFLAFILALLPIGQAESNTEIITAELEYELDDPELIEYLEEQVYSELLTELGSADYFVENVTAVYYSKEFLETLAANSRENIYFGYTISDLEAEFKGDKYVFTLGEEGKTTVRPFEEYDDTYEQIMRDVAIGAGVIVLCITVKAVAAAAGASAAAGTAVKTVCSLVCVTAQTGQKVTAKKLGTHVVKNVGIPIVKNMFSDEEEIEESIVLNSEGMSCGVLTSVSEETVE